jgi:hypothetical protein
LFLLIKLNKIQNRFFDSLLKVFLKIIFKNHKYNQELDIKSAFELLNTKIEKINLAEVIAIKTLLNKNKKTKNILEEEA